MWKKIISPSQWRPLPAIAATVFLLVLAAGVPILVTAPWQTSTPTGAVSGPPGLPGVPGMPASTPAPAATAAPAPIPAPAAPALPALGGEDTITLRSALEPGEVSVTVTGLEVAQRKVISTASMSVEVEVVQTATAEVRAIAESLGGFVERLSRSGNDDRQQASVTIRVPQEAFFTALERIEALGEVLSQSVGTEDVTEQFIDKEARLKSALREEESFLSLLEKTRSISEILSIERELSRVRSEIERLQGQLNFLERRVELATIAVTLSSPRPEVAQPPSASLTVEVANVAETARDVKALISSLDGVVDGSFLSVRDGSETANLSLRVFSKNFEQTMAAIEGQGKVRSKEMREGTTPKDEEPEPPKEPDARIEVAFVEKTGPWTTGLIVAIAAPTGGVALALLLGLLFYLTYRAGRRGGSLS